MGPTTDRLLPFACECGDVGCEKCVPLTAKEYEDLPYKPPGLALAQGHELLPPPDEPPSRVG